MVKSLLGKSSTPGSTWGELAGMYLSGGRKKDNRARNILLASLFFNAKEASMQSKVMKQLEDLEDTKDLQLANLNSEFKKKLELQTVQDNIDKNGVFGYYKNDALAAFEDKHKDKMDYFNVDSDEARKAKNQWMENWSNEQYKLHQERYNKTDPNIQTLEQFTKPYMDYYKAEKRKIASPQNISLVHNLFGKIGIGNKYDDELETKYTEAQQTYNKDTERRKAFAYAPTSRAVVDAIPESKAKSFAISPEAFREKAAAFGVSEELYSEALTRWNAGTKSESSAESILLGITANSVVLTKKKQISDVRETYELTKPKEAESMEYKGWERKRNKAIRDVMGMSDAKQDLEDIGNDYIDIMISTGNLKEEEREAKLKQFVKAKVGKELGEIDVASLQSSIIEGTLTRAIVNVMDGDSDALAAIQSTALDQADIAKLQKTNKAAYDRLASFEFDVVKATQGLQETNPIVQAIRIYQEGRYYANVTEAATSSANLLPDLLEKTTAPF
jgi:hypothetical protein